MIFIISRERDVKSAWQGRRGYFSNSWAPLLFVRASAILFLRDGSFVPERPDASDASDAARSRDRCSSGGRVISQSTVFLDVFPWAPTRSFTFYTGCVCVCVCFSLVILLATRALAARDPAGAGHDPGRPVSIVTRMPDVALPPRTVRYVEHPRRFLLYKAYTLLDGACFTLVKKSMSIYFVNPS